MTDEPVQDQSISVGRDAINSTLITGSGNVVKIYNMGWREDDAPERAKLFGANPYRGMVAFSEKDAERFYGRGELIHRLWERFRDLSCAEPDEGTCRLLPILGPSGSGKSSVARAGLLAELARRPLPGRTGQRVAVLTPGARPLESLANILACVATEDPMPTAKSDEFEAVLARGEEGERHGLRRIAGMLPNARTQPLVLLVDQFEEVFSLCRDAEHRKIFIETLLDAAGDPDGTLSVIITLRTDFLGQTQAHNALNQVIARQGVLVPTMSEAELRAAVDEPARKAGHRIDADTVRGLVLETAGREGALPLLQFMLVKIWEGMVDGRKPEDTINDLGGVGGAVAATANAIYEKLTPDAQEIARRAFLAMVTFNADQQPTRRRAPVSEMVTVGEDPTMVRRVLERFANYDSRLIVLSAAADGEQTAEVTHEALFGHWDKLKAWLEEGREDLRFHQRVADAAQEWQAQARPLGSLWRPPNLDLLQAFAARAGQRLSQLEGEFLTASHAAYDSEVRQTRRQTSNLLAAAAYQALLDDDAPLAILLGLEALPATDADSPDYARAEATLLAAVLNQHELWRFRASPFRSLQPSSDRTRFLVASHRQAWMFETATGRLIRRFDQDGQGEISAVADPTGRRVLLPRWLKPPQIWGTEAPNAAPVVIADGDNNAAWAFAPDGRRIVTVGWDHSLAPQGATGPPAEDGAAPGDVAPDPPDTAAAWTSRAFVLDADTGETLATLAEATGHVSRAVWSPDGARIATDGDEELRVWEAASGRLLAALPDRRNARRDAAYSPDGAILAVSQGDDVLLMDSGTLEPLGRLPGDGRSLWGFAFSPDRARMLTWAGDGPPRIWTGIADVGRGAAADLSVAASLEGHERAVLAAAFTPDGRRVVTASADGTARIWDVSDGQCVGELRGHLAEVTHVACTAGEGPVLTASRDDTVRLWRGPGLGPVASFAGADGAHLSSAAFSPDGARVLGTDHGGNRWAWSAETGALIQATPSVVTHGSIAAISPDGALLARRSDDGVEVLDAHTGVVVTALQIWGVVNTVAFVPDGRALFTISMGHAALWDLPSGKRRFALGDIHPGVTFSPDGRRLLLGDRSSRLITKRGGHVRLPGSGGFGTCGAFSPDGGTVAASFGPAVEIWDVSGETLHATLRGHRGKVTAVAYSPDGRLLATAAEDQTIRLWDAELGQWLATIGRHPGSLVSLAFSPNGGAVLGRDEYKGAMLWRFFFARGQQLREAAAGRTTRDFTPEERRRFGIVPAPEGTGG